MKKINLTLPLLAIICSAVFTGCWSAPGNTNTATNTSSANAAPAANSNVQSPAEPSNTAEAIPGKAYPQDTREAFLRSCQGAGSTQAFCVCVFEKVEAKYSFAEFKKIEDAMLDGEPPAEFVQFTEKTRAECTK